MNFLQELLEKYQVRKTNAQKEAFLSWAQAQCKGMGYAARVEENKGSKLCRNLVAGDIEMPRWFSLPITIPAQKCRYPIWFSPRIFF